MLTSNGPGKTGRPSSGGAVPLRRPRTVGLGSALIVAGIVAIALAHVMARAGDGARQEIRLATLATVAVAVILLATGMTVLVGGLEEPGFRVFRGPRLLAAAVAMLALAAVLIGALVAGRPFAEFASTGSTTATVIAEIGTLLAAISLLVGAGATWFDARDLRAAERRWSRELRAET